MIIVHDILASKPGNASKLAKKFKDAMVEKPRPLTHLTTTI